MKTIKTTKLRKPYRIKVFDPAKGEYLEGWAVGKRWYREQYESPSSRLLVKLDNGQLIEVFG